MLQLVGVADVRVEFLPLVVIPFAAVGFEEVPAVFREDGCAFVFTLPSARTPI